MFKKVLLVTVAAGLLTACADRWDVDGARSMANSGGAFSQALQKDYATLAAAERAEYDWGDAAYFVAKAKAAAMGQNVQPTALDERDLDEPFASQAASMRAELMTALASDNARKMPEVAAQAQALGFDCYMQEAEEGFQMDDIAACKAAFDSAMKTLGKTQPVAVMQGPYIVYFKTGSAKLDATAMTVLQAAANAYKANKAVTLVISGHTDTVGSSNSNILLSQKRAESVATALTKMGVKASAMALEAYGEEKLRVSTVDGQAEPQNRRAEVLIKSNGK